MRQKHATCKKIALCKRGYLCDMRLLHVVTGMLKSFNFLATACNSRISHKQARLQGMFLSHHVNAPSGTEIEFGSWPEPLEVW